MSICLYLFFGNISMPLLCQYIYASSMATSLCLFNGNISASSMAIYLCLFYGNISMPLLWKCLYNYSMAIYLCLFYGNISLLLRAIAFCFSEIYPSASVSNLLWKDLCFYDQCILLLRAISLCLCKQCLYVSLLLRAISLILRAMLFCTFLL